MPAPRSFWVILIGKTPTSFRANAREDLVPTLRQLQRTQSEVTLRWFERGKVWESPEAAIGAAKLAATTAREKRTKEWRPGGEHRDPKARFELTRDQKRAKFKRERPGNDDGPRSPFGSRPPREPGEPRPDRPNRPWADRNKPAGRPWSDRPKSPFGDRGPRPPSGERRDRPSGDRPFGDRPPRRDRPSGPPMENPFKDRPGPGKERPDGENRRGPRPDSRRPFDGGRGERRPSGPGRPPRPGRPPSDRGGFKPPKRRG